MNNQRHNIVGVLNATITEKRAPTEDSVRLLREFEQQAKSEIIKSIRVSDNTFDCVLHMMDDHLSCQKMFRVIYSLNGKKLTTDYRCDMSLDSGIDVMITGLIDALARDIALEILQEPITKAIKQINQQR